MRVIAGHAASPDARRHVLEILARTRRPNDEERADIAGFVADGYARSNMRAREKALALDIIHRLADDASQSVRGALAHCLAESPLLPPMLAHQFANDIAAVAEPVLRCSLALTDSELIRIVGEGDEGKQIAIALRQKLSEPLSQALVEKGSERAVVTLLGNRGAAIAESGYRHAVARFPESVPVLAAIGRREDISPALAVDIVLHASAGVKRLVEETIDLPAPFVENLVLRAREHALVGHLEKLEGTELLVLARRIAERGQLTDSLILRALMLGDRALFEAATAVRAGAGLVPTGVRLYRRGPHALREFLEQAGFGEILRRTTLLALPLLEPLDENDSDARHAYSSALIERIVQNMRGIAPGSVENVLAQLLAQ
ncbi:MAG: hypothetical protein Tsb008_10620 [Rhodothalassiaceae bacterium]